MSASSQDCSCRNQSDEKIKSHKSKGSSSGVSFGLDFLTVACSLYFMPHPSRHSHFLKWDQNHRLKEQLLHCFLTSWDSLFDCPANTFALHISVLYPFIFIIFSNQRKCYRQYCTWLLEKDQFTNSWFRPISIDHQLVWELSLERVSMHCCVQSNRESTNTSNCWILWFRLVYLRLSWMSMCISILPVHPSLRERTTVQLHPSVGVQRK